MLKLTIHNNIAPTEHRFAVMLRGVSTIFFSGGGTHCLKFYHIHYLLSKRNKKINQIFNVLNANNLFIFSVSY